MRKMTKLEETYERKTVSKLHYCENGRTVTDQVIFYKKLKSSGSDKSHDEYLPIKNYYDKFKDLWFNQVSDYLDRETFETEFDFKVVRAVEGFQADEARRLASTHGWSYLGMFNRWLYTVLQNWKSNVKSSSIRVKKRPSIVCPICSERIGRIDAEHLQHFKTLKHLPSFFDYKDRIYKVCLIPSDTIITYGRMGKNKLAGLNNGSLKGYINWREEVDWPFYDKHNVKVVVCPLTKRLAKEINNEYLMTLPKKINRYAKPMSWEEFIETYPNTLIQSKEYQLDYENSEDCILSDSVERDYKNPDNTQDDPELDVQQVLENKVTVKYEDVFYWIDKHVDDDRDREILKLISIGYTLDDIAESLSVQKTEVKRRIKGIRENSKDLRETLLEMV